MTRSSELQIYLASQSPRRRELLDQIGIHFQTLDLAVDELPAAGESPDAFVRRAALDKARAGWAAPVRRLERPVLGADTAVVLGHSILGKPRHRAHALEMLRALSGREHRVLTAVAVVVRDREVCTLSENKVIFREVTEVELDAYWRSGEPADKAGAYAIQGLGAVFVSRIEGSYSGVMGLPLFETAGLLSELGIDVF